MFGFFQWWLEWLAGDFWNRPARGLADALIVGIAPEQFSFHARRGGVLSDLGSFPAEETAPVVLWLPAAWILRKHLVLPLAARADLPRLLGYEMERETPFSLGEIWWTHRVLKVDESSRTIEVEMILVPRAPVEPVLERLRAEGMEPAWIECEDNAGSMDLIPLGTAPPPRMRLDRFLRGPGARLGIAAAGLATVAVTLPFARQYYELGVSAGEIARLRADKSFRPENGIEAQVAAERSRLGHPLAALAEVTRLFPDGTYLTGFSLQGGIVRLTGFSPDAAGLIGILAKSPVFSDPALASPVTRSAETGLESFVIRAGFGAGGAG